MKSTTVVFLLCVTLCVANASWLESFFNSTRLRGKLGLNTTNGLKIDYNGKLGFDNGFLAVDLVDVGAKFNAQPKEIENDANNKSVAYAAGFELNHNGHKANVTVLGVAGAKSHVDRTNGTSDYIAGIANVNQWNVTSGNYAAVGGHIGSVNISGHVNQNGSLINGDHKVKAAQVTFANISIDGKHIGAGGIAHAKQAHIKSHIYLVGHNANASESRYQGYEDHHKPDAVGNAQIDYKGATKIQWNDDSRVYTKKGHAGVDGIGWFNVSKEGNDTVVKVGVAKNIDYQHVGKVYENDKQVADFMTVGDVALLKKGGVKIEENGDWQAGAGSTGVVNQWSLIKNKHNDKSSDEFLSESDESSPLGKGISGSKIKAQWAHGTLANGTHDANNNTAVSFHSGTLYHINADLPNHKPWEAAGHKSVNGGLIVVPGGNSVENVTLNFGN